MILKVDSELSSKFSPIGGFIHTEDEKTGSFGYIQSIINDDDDRQQEATISFQ